MWGQVVDRVSSGHLLYAQMAFLALPGLRGFWPMSAVDESGNVACMPNFTTTIARLTKQGDPVFGYDGFLPYVEFDGTGDYLSHSDTTHFDILGTESYIENPGLTFGGLFNVGNDSDVHALIGKYGAATYKSFQIMADGGSAGDPVTFYVSDDGSNTDSVSISGYSINTWHLIIARFDDNDTGEEMKIWLDDESETASTDRNSIANTAYPFTIGAVYGSPIENPMTGKASLCFLCASALSDSTISELYNLVQPFLG